ncbi:chemical-damaging agent resistance protein C [Sinomonas cyclohexanicum]|uniref:Chemical-damaging agent resistance protein C n=1 Tax=Sinomonas cyclohexanicum TaxID=322009 RepID=A0ABM7PZX0_SINCY|nr:TerD family protein [Corynebacterium cyclohexanicum]BCT77856.1 chemical-damaging agent resistance protein C [Corynebacterium cyclohexanicum]
MATMVAGSNAPLTAENPGLAGVMVAMGWQVVPSNGPQSELTSLAIVCGEDGRALSPEHLVFFNQLTTAGGGVRFASSPNAAQGTAHGTGQGTAQDAEQVDVEFGLVPAEVAKIAFLAYVDPEVRGPGTFGAVRSAYIRLARPDGSELLRFDLPEIHGEKIKAMMFGELYRHGEHWKFRALGQGYENGLAGVARDFGLDL